ncbi:MAG: hypothetical protein HC904_09365 [Blastochloris sp.]|nr:hypothetical protein [Blastochloris sp.]
MTLDFVAVFSLYVLVFLAVIFTVWILFLWKQQREHAREGRRYLCVCCGKTIKVDHALIQARCPHCGARNDLHRIKPLDS